MAKTSKKKSQLATIGLFSPLKIPCGQLSESNPYCYNAESGEDTKRNDSARSNKKVIDFYRSFDMNTDRSPKKPVILGEEEYKSKKTSLLSPVANKLLFFKNDEFSKSSKKAAGSQLKKSEPHQKQVPFSSIFQKTPIQAQKSVKKFELQSNKSSTSIILTVPGQLETSTSHHLIVPKQDRFAKDPQCHYLHQHTEPSPISPFSHHLSQHPHIPHHDGGLAFLRMKTTSAAVIAAEASDNKKDEQSSEDMFDRDEDGIEREEEVKTDPSPQDHKRGVTNTITRGSQLHLSRHIMTSNNRSQNESSVRSTIAQQKSKKKVPNEDPEAIQRLINERMKDIQRKIQNPSATVKVGFANKSSSKQSNIPKYPNTSQKKPKIIANPTIQKPQMMSSAGAGQLNISVLDNHTNNSHASSFGQQKEMPVGLQKSPMTMSCSIKGASNIDKHQEGSFINLSEKPETFNILSESLPKQPILQHQRIVTHLNIDMQKFSATANSQPQTAQSRQQSDKPLLGMITKGGARTGSFIAPSTSAVKITPNRQMNKVLQQHKQAKNDRKY